MSKESILNQIIKGSEKAGKVYTFDDTHDQTKPAQMWFQESEEGLILFIVFYSQACRWSRCLGCNLPSLVSTHHIPYKALMAQIDHVMNDSKVMEQRKEIRKIIVSNNGSILDQDTFSSTALMYMIAQFNLNIPGLRTLSIETRPEYVEFEELEFLARALAEGDTPTQLEIAIGFEAFDDDIRNKVFDKGLSLDIFEGLIQKMAPYGYKLKCYFMQKPVPNMSDEASVKDIRMAIDYLNDISLNYTTQINMHLNPTYVASGTLLEPAFKKGDFSPPLLKDVARSAYHGRDKNVSIFIGLSDEGLAVKGGSFIRPGEETLIKQLERFNRTQDYSILNPLF